MMETIKDKSVLVTGGAGFIGSHLVDELIKQGTKKVVVVDNFFLGKIENLKDALNSGSHVVIYRENAGDYFAMAAILREENIDVVFNLATKALIYSFFNPIGAYMENVEIARALVELQREGYFQTLIHCSSSEVYGSAQYVPMDENHPFNPTTPYSAGKAAADLMILSIYNTLKLDVSIIRPFNNYGPRQNDGKLAGIIPLTIKRILNNEKPIIEGTGEQTRDFIFVGDTVKNLIAGYCYPVSRGKVLNIGSGIQVPVIKIVRAICV